MPRNSIPLPENYIVWRDNDGRYHTAKRPPDLHAPMPSRTRAVQWLWGEFGRVYKQPSDLPYGPSYDLSVWDAHFSETPTEESTTHDHDERNQPVH